MSNIDCVLAGLAERIKLAHEGAIRSLCTSIEYAIDGGKLLWKQRRWSATADRPT